MRLARLLVVLAGAAALAGMYVAAPLLAAHDIRRAARAGDVARLEQKVEWASVRESLKASLRTGPLAAELEGHDGTRRSLWQRVKAAAAPSVADRLVDRFVTPQGMSQLARSGDALGAIRRAAGLDRGRLMLEPASAQATGAMTADTGGSDAFLALISRLRRIELHSPFHFEFEIADRQDPRRRFVSTMRLRGLDWKLTEVRLVTG